MTITDDMLVSERPYLGGEQRIYLLPNGYRLSLVNSPALHAYSFAWEAAVLNPEVQRGLAYDTPLTEDIEVFYSDDEANDFIARAKAWALDERRE